MQVTKQCEVVKCSCNVRKGKDDSPRRPANSTFSCIRSVLQEHNVTEITGLIWLENVSGN